MLSRFHNKFLHTHYTIICTKYIRVINSVDNSSGVNESQPININSINLNNHVSNDCESSSNEIHNISPTDTTTDKHFGSGNIATRVKARNEKARRMTAHKQSQHLKARNLGNTSSSESPSYEY